MEAKHSTWHLTSMATSINLARSGVTVELEIGQSDFKHIIHGTPKDMRLQRNLPKALSKHAAPTDGFHGC